MGVCAFLHLWSAALVEMQIGWDLWKGCRTDGVWVLVWLKDSIKSGFWKKCSGKIRGGQSEVREPEREDCGGGTGIDDRIWGSSSQPGATYPWIGVVVVWRWLAGTTGRGERYFRHLVGVRDAAKHHAQEEPPQQRLVWPDCQECHGRETYI